MGWLAVGSMRVLADSTLGDFVQVGELQTVSADSRTPSPMGPKKHSVD